LTVDNKGTYRDKFMIYVPPEKKRIYEKLKHILRREGRTVSRWFLEQAEIYVRLHEPGNPQQVLNHFFENDKPYRAPKICGFRSCGKPCVAIAVHDSGFEMPVCAYHIKILSQEPEWKIKNSEGNNEKIAE